MSRINYRERCPTCGSETWCGSDPYPAFKPVPLTEDVRRDLWLYFGEPLEWISNGSWPTLPSASVRYPSRSEPELLDTPFTRAFLLWRERRENT